MNKINPIAGRFVLSNTSDELLKLKQNQETSFKRNSQFKLI